MDLHDRVVRRFRRQLTMLLLLKYALPLATMWGIVWGIVVLVLRAAAGVERKPLLWGLAGLIACVAVAIVRTRRRLPAGTAIRALLDEQSGCGGLLMAGAERDLGGWRQKMPVLLSPTVHWDGRRAGTLLAIAAGFVLLSFLAPQGLADLASTSPLEIDREIARLVEQIALLRTEAILEPERADTLGNKLADLREHASGKDPARTLEALDHLQNLAAKAAHEAAEDRARRSERLTEAESLAEILHKSADMLSPKLKTEALAELAGLMDKNGLDLAQIAKHVDPELMKAVREKMLNPEHLKKLAEALRDSKLDLARQVEKMQKAGLIDLELLEKFRRAGEGDGDGLQEFLKKNKGKATLADIKSQNRRVGDGVRHRGPGEAPLILGEANSQERLKFKEEVLPPGALASLKSGQTVPAGDKPAQLVLHNKSSGPTSSGALRGAAAGSGSANTENVLPRHRAVVERYFHRKSEIRNPKSERNPKNEQEKQKP